MKKFACTECDKSYPCSLTMHHAEIGNPAFCPINGDESAKWREVKSKSKK